MFPLAVGHEITFANIMFRFKMESVQKDGFQKKYIGRYDFQ